MLAEAVHDPLIVLLQMQFRRNSGCLSEIIHERLIALIGEDRVVSWQNTEQDDVIKQIFFYGELAAELSSVALFSMNALMAPMES